MIGKLLPLLLVALMAPSARGEETTRLFAGAPSRLVLEGSSNLAPWHCSGTTLDGTMQVAAPLAQINSVIDRIEDGNIGVFMNNPAAGRFPQPTFQLKIPVTTLRCGNRQMEKDMYRALRADDFPSIEFRFTQLAGAIDHDIDAGLYRTRINGVLALAGATRNIAVAVEAQRLAPNRFRLRARLPLRMTDFRITPPTALFGMVKAKDDLYVSFDLVLQTVVPREAK
ncbi:MAG TPA: YceI family protein [Thermoanaerobaculia bacterium]|nr:YceI family protein [Thermoanaerobaculia bacterium]